MIIATISGELGLVDRTISTDKAKLSQKKSSNSIHYTTHKQMMMFDKDGLPPLRGVGIVMFTGSLCLIVALIIRRYARIKAYSKRLIFIG